MTAPVRSTIAVGWPLLPLPDENGQLAWPDAETSVRQTIEAILRTRPGEQLMRPRFGGGLEDFVHEPNTLTTRRRIHDAIVAALTTWEPRVTLDRVEVWEVASDADPGARRDRVSAAPHRRRGAGRPHSDHERIAYADPSSVTR